MSARTDLRIGHRVLRVRPHGMQYRRPRGPPAPGRIGARCSARRQLWLIAAVQVLAMALWFSASAGRPQPARRLGRVADVGHLLTVAVQLGFVTGALASAALDLADRIGRRC